MSSKTVAQWRAHILAQLGTSEDPLGSNHTRYGVQFGFDRVAWCAIFGWCMYSDAGVFLPIKSASCVAIYDWARANGFLRTDPRNAAVGDSIIRTWQRLNRDAPGFDWSQTHYQEVIGIRTEDGVLWLDLAGGNQGMGVVSTDTVRVDDPTLLGVIAWSRLFAAPSTTPAKTITPGKPTAAKSHLYPTALLEPGASGPLVRQLQQRLNDRVPHAGLALDGSYGPATTRAVIAFQRMDGLTADGIVGPQTWLKLYPR